MKAVLAALRRVAGSERPLDFLAALWPLIVGARLAEHTRPAQWRKGVLQVAVSDREWHEQLERMPGMLRARINKWWGADLIEEVTFLRGAAARASSPPMRPEAKSSKAAPAKEAKIEELRDALARIRDPEFRELVERVAAKYLARAATK